MALKSSSWAMPTKEYLARRGELKGSEGSRWISADVALPLSYLNSLNSLSSLNSLNSLFTYLHKKMLLTAVNSIQSLERDSNDVVVEPIPYVAQRLR